MMRWWIRAFSYTVLVAFGLLSAQTRELSLEDVALHWYDELAPERVKQLQWLPETDRFAYVEMVDSVETLFVGTAGSGKSQPRLSLTGLNRWLEREGLQPLHRFPRIHWQDEHSFWFWKGDSLILTDMNKKQVQVHTYFSGEHANVDVAEKTLMVAFTRENNLYLLRKNGEEVAITADTDPGIVNGQEVHRQEFGIRKGTFWSPENRYLAFYRKDEREVTDYPYVDFTTRPAQVKPDKYPMAGMTNHIATVGIYHVETGRTVWLETGEPADQYLTNLTWTPDEKYLLIAQINRDQNHLRMVQYDIHTGKPVRTIFEEKEEKYLDPQVGPFFHPRNSRRFLWLSRRDGWNHFYEYDLEQGFIRQLTRGEWEVIEGLGFDPKGRYLFFIANREHPLQRDLYRLDLRGGELRRCTTGEGTHSARVSPSGKYFLDEFTSLETPLNTTLYRISGKKIRTLKQSPNPLAEYRVGEIKLLPITIEEGVTLYGRLIFPPNFDPSRKYPLIVYVYGGPHSQLVRNAWTGGFGSWQLWLYYLAQRGYVIFTVDNRGTYNRGKAFEQATFRHLGTVEIADQLAALDYVKQMGFVDTTRIGVMGWSFGGFMATSLMLRAPEVFKVGIAGAPVIDWKYYETIYTERYMDTPETNPEGYQESSTLNYVDQLRGRLLLIHGTSDPVVMWQHTILFLKAAIQAGVQPDYFVYPGHPHGIYGPDRLHLLEKMTRYFEEHL